MSKRAMCDERLARMGVRGKHAKRFCEGTNLVLIAPDLHEIFPTPKRLTKPFAAIFRSATEPTFFRLTLQLARRLGYNFLSADLIRNLRALDKYG
jgi:hypothetical protein